MHAAPQHPGLDIINLGVRPLTMHTQPLPPSPDTVSSKLHQQHAHTAHQLATLLQTLTCQFGCLLCVSAGAFGPMDCCSAPTRPMAGTTLTPTLLHSPSHMQCATPSLTPPTEGYCTSLLKPPAQLSTCPCKVCAELAWCMPMDSGLAPSCLMQSQPLASSQVGDQVGDHVKQPLRLHS
jgi:hypothetical protein